MASAETDPRALAPASVSFDALASAGASLLRSPVSGQACVYWRVRIKQRLSLGEQIGNALGTVAGRRTFIFRI